MDKTTTERGEAAGAAESNPKSSPTNVPSTTDTTAKQSSSAPPLKQPKKRTKTGCLTCRKRRIKCGEEKPRCKNCTKANRECVWYPHQITSRNSLGFLATSNSPLTPGLSPMAWPHQASQLTDGQRSHAYQRLLAPRMSPTAEPTGFSSGISDPSLVRFPHQTSPSNDPHIETRPFHLPQDNAGPLYTTESLPNENAPFGAMNSSAAGFPRSYKAPHDPLASLHGTHSGIPGDIGQHSQQLSPNELLTRESSFSTQTENRSPHDVGQSPSASVSQIHPRAQVQDHDGIDLESDVDMEEEQTPVAGSNQLSMIMASAGQDGGLIRSYTAFLNKPNILTSYRPSLGSSPLNNPVTARIWVHFIHATGPSLSIWERHHINSSIFFTGHVPASQQGLWNYTMPLRSLEHPALLQAILAVSSLHVSKLQEAPLTVPLRHYHYSLRRLWKALSLPLRRKDVATLATTLVLGFFEVMAAEHVKWNSHVAGAVQLIKEIDFTRLTRDLRIYRREAKARKQDRWGLYDSSTSHVYNEDDPFAEKEAEVSDAVLSVLSGNPVNYDQAGHVESDDYQSSRKPYFTAKDIEEFRIQCDLYWWYCKQDLFQALISGNELFLPYNQWTQCPPRAGLGKADALYGSFDHLVLLLGRLVDFGFRDRKRKLKALEKFGGEWRPHQGFLRFLSRFAAKPSGAGHPGPPADTDGVGQHPYPGADSSTRFSPSSPEFPQAPQPGHQTSLANHGDLAFDMLSNAGHNQIPVMPAPMGQSTPYSESPREDLDQSLAEAELEWEAINGAFDFFPQQLGPEFAPLPADSVAPMASPFGPAVQYRSQQIAVLWAFYYTGRIVLNRFHPCMPPAAMVAAFTAAATTEEYAMLIGKIMAGIYYSQQYSLETGSVNPTLGAILIDMCLPMFFAGVQFMDKAQREWTISTLRSISRLTGWQSAAAIATGCETAWRSAAKAGKGPPYSPPETFSSFESSHKGRIYRGPLADKQVDIQDSNAIADRRFVKVAKPARTRWAMGLLEMEEDLVNLSLDDRPGSRT